MRNYFVWIVSLLLLVGSVSAVTCSKPSSTTSGAQSSTIVTLHYTTLNYNYTINLYNGSNVLINSSNFYNVTGDVTYSLDANSTYYHNATGIGLGCANANSNNYTFTTPSNALIFTTYNELTGVLITNLTTITLSNEFNSYTYNTNSSGQALALNIVSGNYSFFTNSSIYSVRTGFVEVSTGPSQYYNIYLSNATAILLNFKAIGGAGLPGVFVQVFSFVNGSLVVVEQGYSGLGGTFQFGGVTNRYYFVNSSKSGLVPYSFELNPILYSSYTIPMSPLLSGAVQPTAYAVWSPSTFVKGRSSNFELQFYSPYSSLTSYNFSLVYPGGSINRSGNSSSGEFFNQTFTITSGSSTDRVTLNLTWITDDNASQNNIYSYPLIVQYSNRTILTGSDKDYGFKIGDKVFLVAIILIPLMGIAWLALGFFGSLTIGGLVLVIILNTGLFTADETQLYIASGVLIVLLLVFRGRT